MKNLHVSHVHEKFTAFFKACKEKSGLPTSEETKGCLSNGAARVWFLFNIYIFYKKLLYLFS
jgi:hypothetical protein